MCPLGYQHQSFQLESEKDEKPDEKYLPQAPAGLEYPIVVLNNDNVPLESIFVYFILRYSNNLSITIVTDEKEELVRKFTVLFLKLQKKSSSFFMYLGHDALYE